ncbi:MAG: hypothetical protein HON90_03345, partial [Halobacteriovoraceae bacterium]|nr:hypothetical protein [Halobacteriovoraceae bacterium]
MKSFNFNPMEKVDQGLLTLTQSIKQSPQYQKALDQYNQLDEWQQSTVNYSLMLLTVIIPLMVCLIFFALYSKQKSYFESYDQIIVSASKIISTKSQLKKQSSKVFTLNQQTQSALTNKITQLLNSSGIDADNVKVTNFDLQESAGINEISALVHFEAFTAKNFYTLVDNLVFRNKYKIKELS